ncbi:hypothetical protein PoB_002470400 [Plakobranchus ocellatus]|uniref:BTB domain-containing protein n=1 Tax=Plakobranchus ocellatus TaxID=259542 RepID=A0AAV3ZW95_9GAST|nr:hypothetical protein PoB_002470400 [Plakobranchus ocellatus]
MMQQGKNFSPFSELDPAFDTEDYVFSIGKDVSAVNAFMSRNSEWFQNLYMYLSDNDLGQDQMNMDGSFALLASLVEGKIIAKWISNTSLLGNLPEYNLMIIQYEQP